MLYTNLSFFYPSVKQCFLFFFLILMIIKLICIYLYFAPVFIKICIFCNCLFISTFKQLSVNKNDPKSLQSCNSSLVQLIYIDLSINTCNELYFISFSKHPLLPMRPSLNPTSAQIISPFTSSESISVLYVVQLTEICIFQPKFHSLRLQPTNSHTHAQKLSDHQTQRIEHLRMQLPVRNIKLRI